MEENKEMDRNQCQTKRINSLLSLVDLSFHLTEPKISLFFSPLYQVKIAKEKQSLIRISSIPQLNNNTNDCIQHN